MSDETAECYRVLGLKPGASAADLKAAYRDLAKVWHPDRFLHDPGLREKAERKLKEINEAYDQLHSGSSKRQTSPAPPYKHRTSTGTKQRIRWQSVVAVALIFFATFWVASRSLLQTRARIEPTSMINAAENSQVSEASTSGETAPAKALPENKEPRKSNDRADGPAVSNSDAAIVRPMPTVTVVIDASTGKLARAGCPTKTSMTYPSGNEPHEYCALHRAVPVPPLEKIDANESRLKTAAKRVVSRVKWFDSKPTGNTNTQAAKTP